MYKIKNLEWEEKSGIYSAKPTHTLRYEIHPSDNKFRLLIWTDINSSWQKICDSIGQAKFEAEEEWESRAEPFLQPLSFAEIIFAGEIAGLVDVSNKIEELVGEDFFQDSSYDYYDGSIEVVFSHNFPGLSREQADEILNLGFDRVYESVGDKGTCWQRESHGACPAREIGQDTRRSVEKMKLALKRAAQLAEIAADWNLGSDGKVEIDGEWIDCRDLEKEFSLASC